MADPDITVVPITIYRASIPFTEQVPIHKSSLPPGISASDVIGGGHCSLIAVHPETKRVLKFAHESRTRGPSSDSIRLEWEIYRRVQDGGTASGSPHIISCFGFFPADSSKYPTETLELEYCPNGTLRDRVRRDKTDRPLPSPAQLFRWAFQIADAVRFIHAKGVWHGDLKLANALLDANGDIKMGDYSASVIVDPEPGSTWYPTKPPRNQTAYRPPDLPTGIATEVFGFGAALFEMWTGKQPYEELFREDLSHCKGLRDLYLQRKFPQLDESVMPAKVIKKCWNMVYENFEQIKNELEEEKIRLVLDG
ncbi:kinase-like domain-containing protein [Lineolata rhizophorae]|uniref:Kinase-like domain-containing protein n=1 Tax=Lineolata rhizophorae TaxID=578093 RepID=A0A6A6P8S7_9PEZI|nr:kinase-like domain-containing protein [Lineolata rhizophorae]